MRKDKQVAYREQVDVSVLCHMPVHRLFGYVVTCPSHQMSAELRADGVKGGKEIARAAASMLS